MVRILQLLFDNQVHRQHEDFYALLHLLGFQVTNSNLYLIFLYGVIHLCSLCHKHIQRNGASQLLLDCLVNC